MDITHLSYSIGLYATMTTKSTVQKLSTVSQIRSHLLKIQGGLCPLCSMPIQTDQAVLDHCHQTGQVRAVLHRNCNQLESKVRGLFKRFGGQHQPQQLLTNLMRLWYGLQHPFLHPDHMTEYKKQARTLRKRLSKLKTEAARGRVQSELKALREKQRAYMQEHCITVQDLENYGGKE